MGRHGIRYTWPMAIRKPAPRRDFPPMEAITADDFYALPDSPERYELFEGMLVMAPPPDFGHQDISGELTVALRLFARSSGGTAVASPVGVEVGTSTVFEPDLVYLAPHQASLIETRGVRGAPALVVEISSPSTRRYDLSTKLPAYLDAGVLEVWIVDPVARTVAVHHKGEPPTTFAFGEPIPSVVVEVGAAGLERFVS